MAISSNAHHVVIPGRSKERSDAAQTLESIPLPLRVAAVQKTSVLLRCALRARSRNGSSGLRVRFAAARPVDDEVAWASPAPNVARKAYIRARRVYIEVANLCV
ncbi:hypothetical protein FJW05_23115 [Mesorhizobium sp. B2-9-1]|nr:hypothetical protein FJW05_23115 [Mesorhizobium sp. B2-9-1]TPJ20898.1 hypothetical protein FJ425_25630 [Mesorhizobium sp. B2-7-2]